jgi:hypothetical protein
MCTSVRLDLAATCTVFQYEMERLAINQSFTQAMSD